MLSHISANLNKHTSLLQMHVMAHPEESMTLYLRLAVNCIRNPVMNNANFGSKLSKALQTLQETSDELQQTRSDQEKTRDKVQQTHDELQETHHQLQEMQERVT